MKKWSDRCRGVTVRFAVEQFRVKIRSRVLPALCVGGVETCLRSNEDRSDRKSAAWVLSVWITISGG